MALARHDIISVTLAAAVGASATFTASYPTGRGPDTYLGGTDHQLFSQQYAPLYANLGDFLVSFGASTITVTNLSNVALAAGTRVWLHLDRAETPENADLDFAAPDRMELMRLIRVNLGAPATAVANGVVASQAATAAGGLATGINGALAAAGVATFDRPRNVVAAWTNTAVITVTGTDEYGRPMRESSASGTSFTGRKAFRTVTGISVSADVTGLTVGSGVVLGLPVFLADVADVIREALDGAIATAGTTVAGVQGAQTATTGDVRGTYSPNSAPNGARVYELTLALRSPSYRGEAQFAG